MTFIPNFHPYVFFVQFPRTQGKTAPSQHIPASLPCSQTNCLINNNTETNMWTLSSLSLFTQKSASVRPKKHCWTTTSTHQTTRRDSTCKNPFPPTSTPSSCAAVPSMFHPTHIYSFGVYVVQNSPQRFTRVAPFRIQILHYSMFARRQRCRPCVG